MIGSSQRGELSPTTDNASEAGPEYAASCGDAVLVELAREGDIAAFEGLVVRYLGPVYRLARRMPTAGIAAGDVALQVFVQAWRQLDRCPDVTRFREWIMNLTVGTCLHVNYRHPADSLAPRPRLPGRRPRTEPAGPISRQVHGKNRAAPPALC